MAAFDQLFKVFRASIFSISAYQKANKCEKRSKVEKKKNCPPVKVLTVTPVSQSHNVTLIPL